MSLRERLCVLTTLVTVWDSEPHYWPRPGTSDGRASVADCPIRCRRAEMRTRGPASMPEFPPGDTRAFGDDLPLLDEPAREPAGVTTPMPDTGAPAVSGALEPGCTMVALAPGPPLGASPLSVAGEIAIALPGWADAAKRSTSPLIPAIDVALLGATAPAMAIPYWL